jgi:hypothetical protein
MGGCGCKKFPDDLEPGGADCHLSPLVNTATPFLKCENALSRIQGTQYSSVMRNILLIILILLLIGAFPGWGYSTGWGYYPFGGIGLVLLIVLILLLTGRL